MNICKSLYLNVYEHTLKIFKVFKKKKQKERQSEK